MKKIVALLLAVSMLFAFVACDTGNGGSGGTGTGSTGSEGGNTGSGSTGGTGSSSTGGSGSGSTGGNGSSSTGGSGSGSTEEQTSYVGTWTGPMGPVTVSITLNADGTLVAYNSDEGFAESNWNVTNSGVTITIPGIGSFDGKLNNGKLEVAYIEQDISLTKVDTTAYVGTWTDEAQVLSITLNADGTVSANNSMEGDTTGFWTVTNSGFIMWLDVGEECPEEGFPGNLQGDELEVDYMGNKISLTKK